MIQESRLLYIVNIDFPPVSGPGVWRALALAKYAALAGHRVHVFCSDRSFWHTRSDKNLLNQLPDSVKITRIPCVYEEDLLRFFDTWRKSSNRLKRAVGARLYWWTGRYLPDEIAHWAIKGGLRVALSGLREKPDAIFTTGPMHLVHAAGYLLTSLRRETVWTMDYRDPWAVDPHYGLVHPGPYQPRLMAWLERHFIARARWVTAVTPGFLAPLTALAGPTRPASSNAKFKVVANGHDLEPEVSSPPRLASSQERPLVIHFNGTLQDNNDVFAHLFRAVAAYRSRHAEAHLPDLRLSFCGLKERVRIVARELGIEDAIVDHGVLTQTESQRVSRAADVLLVTVKPGLLTSAGVVPAKLYEAIALGKPILALVPMPSDVRDILADDAASPCVEPNDDTALLNSLISLGQGLLDGSGPLGALSDEANRRQRLALAMRYARKSLSGDLLQLMGFSTASGQ